MARNGDRVIGYMLVLIAVLLVIYVLSIGPANLILMKTGARPDFARRFYAPIVWLHDNTVLQIPLEYYVHLWEQLSISGGRK